MRLQEVLIGLSGGIDSSLTATIAVEAVGREERHRRRHAWTFSSDHSVADARTIAKDLGIRFELIPITPAYRKLSRPSHPSSRESRPDVTEENSSRVSAGATLMAFPTSGRVAHDRQQERDRGGLLHALRRYVRRSRRLNKFRSGRIFECHHNALAEFGQSSLNLFRLGIVFRVQHAPDHRFADAKPPGKLGVQYALFTHREIQASFGAR